MAKKSNRGKKSTDPSKKRSSPPPRNPIYMGAVGLLAAAWVAWRLESSQGLGIALLAGILVFGAWLVFVLLMNRSTGQGNDD
jgi:hypothetical protein